MLKELIDTFYAFHPPLAEFEKGIKELCAIDSQSILGLSSTELNQLKAKLCRTGILADYLPDAHHHQQWRGILYDFGNIFPEDGVDIALTILKDRHGKIYPSTETCHAYILKTLEEICRYAPTGETQNDYFDDAIEQIQEFIPYASNDIKLYELYQSRIEKAHALNFKDYVQRQNLKALKTAAQSSYFKQKMIHDYLTQAMHAIEAGDNHFALNQMILIQHHITEKEFPEIYGQCSTLKHQIFESQSPKKIKDLVVTN